MPDADLDQDPDHHDDHDDGEYMMTMMRMVIRIQLMFIIKT